MPKGDGTGPRGQGAGKGRGLGRRSGRMGGNRPGAGPAGNCICSGCGARIPHRIGIPCYSVKCPKCGAPMVRAQ